MSHWGSLCLTQSLPSLTPGILELRWWKKRTNKLSSDLHSMPCVCVCVKFFNYEIEMKIVCDSKWIIIFFFSSTEVQTQTLSHTN